MNRIVFTRQGAAEWSLRLPVSLMSISLVLFSVVFAGGLSVGYLVAENSEASAAKLTELRKNLEEQRESIEVARRDTTNQVNALALRLGQMNASVIRLNALGHRLTDMAGIEAAEFDFARTPSIGGLEVSLDGAANPELPSLTEDLDRLSAELVQRELQLDVLENVLMTRKLNDRVYPRGRPVKSGWMSSYYGNRADPMNGKPSWHGGLDFAGKPGTEIIAAADGVVSWSRERYGFGNLVEINHGNGYVTRYAHNKENLVALGDTVEQGQIIALMGSTGRSTGTHLHFEVWKDGKSVNPLKFVNR
ncbi:MAG: M23 family metallopeptidase [Gammaproteobacteria bacterium]|nr:M23 family metallopeptidase [Gammaproteobacteria bacterium]